MDRAAGPHRPRNDADLVRFGTAAEEGARLGRPGGARAEVGRVPAVKERRTEIEEDVRARGTYAHTEEEIVHGARVAWRNSAKCIGERNLCLALFSTCKISSLNNSRQGELRGILCLCATSAT